MSENKLYAVVVTFNGERLIRKCIDSLQNSISQLNIVIVDNASGDTTVNIIESEYPGIVLFRSKKNLGFGNANNIGIKYAYENGATFVLLLNQDAWIEPGTIQKLIEISIDNPEYYLLSPVHLNKEGTDFDNGFMIYALPPFCENWFFDLFSSKKKALYSTTFVNAAAWLMKRDTINQIGFFDPLFFHYGEDKDYCNRLTFHKKKIGIVTDAIIHHTRESGEVNNLTVMNKLKKDISRNYFLKLIEFKRLDQSFLKLCILFSFGLVFSMIKKLVTLRFYLAAIEGLTLLQLISDLYTIFSHRKMCSITGETFIESISINSLAK